ncbi:hypothetical protein RHMOL_Rhmol11G0053700 [Rhododendron molle]|uniref:Uncharacterized protein n=1 Tax=Rhododendron molle TaxID=49168 RepID=A0ACC0LNU5_RHOML|nr:hypothetical protein RHMOL_Rhmol11G0053700 [Rhododendron molle]
MISSIWRWPVVCQEVRVKRKKHTWEGIGQAMASGGDGKLPSREEAAAVVEATAAMEVDSSSAVTPANERADGEDLAAAIETGEGSEAAVSASVDVGTVERVSGDEVTRGGDGQLARSGGDGMGHRGETEVDSGETTGGGRVVTVVGEGEIELGDGSGGVDSEAVRGGGGELATSSRDALGDGEDGTSSGGGAMGTLHTPTVEDLFMAAERAGDERRDGADSKVMIAGRVVVTPVLRATTVEPRGGDSGIGASHPVPFTEGDFLDTARPRDILDALGLDAGITEVLRGVRTTEDQTSSLLLGALLSGAGTTAADTGLPEMDDLGMDEPEGEAVMVEERVTAADESKAYLASERPGFAPETYAPRPHLFEPTGMTGYVPARDDYPEDMLLRDRATHISTG